MRKDAVTNFLLLVIAIALIAIAVRPYVDPAPALAQSASAHAFYIEPGVQMLRYPDGTGQVYGKVVVDLRSGKVWGFPTGTPIRIRRIRWTASHGLKTFCVGQVCV